MKTHMVKEGTCLQHACSAGHKCSRNSIRITKDWDKVDCGRCLKYRETGELTLKWGTLKGWNLTSVQGMRLLREYFKIGACMSCAMQKDTPRQKEIVLELIDLMPGKIYLDWDGKYVTKEQAKKYVMEYGNEQ